jgi:hypothetical protein
VRLGELTKAEQQGRLLLPPLRSHAAMRIAVADRLKVPA